MRETDLDELSPDQVAQRRDAAIARALATPPTPRKEDKVRARSSKPKQAKKPA
jgi:hypothetical protein